MGTGQTKAPSFCRASLGHQKQIWKGFQNFGSLCRQREGVFQNGRQNQVKWLKMGQIGHLRVLIVTELNNLSVIMVCKSIINVREL